MFKLFFALPTVLLFGLLPQEPAATPSQAVPIPIAAPSLPNPVKPTAASQTRAKTIYGMDCLICHGENGNGKGDLVGDMHLTMKDFSDSSVLKEQTDGELFNVIKNGKDKMPAEGPRAKDDEVWNLVILIRSFSKS